MDFKKVAILGSYISKDYAEDLFKLLYTYKDISASEAASRLNLHIKTVQDFLEAMAAIDVLDRKEVFESKRPYYRYSLKQTKISLDIDLKALFADEKKPYGKGSLMIREKMNAGARFTTARNNQYISNVVIWLGKGRDRQERKINLTIPQGKFLFYLPFPSASFQSIHEIMEKAGVSSSHASEIFDIVDVLKGFEVIETQ
jgi:hypothetical protein